jgi:hypothetical protein
MSTPAKLAANQRNALRSTGPPTTGEVNEEWMTTITAPVLRVP